MKKKTPLAVKLAITMVAIVAAVLIICWIFNSLFLEKYYRYEKQQDMITAFNTIYSVDSNGKIEGEEFTGITFRKLTQEGNLSITISLPTGTFITSMPEVELKELILQFGNLLDFNYENVMDKVIESDNYVMYSQQDNRLKGEYLILIGSLPDGGNVVIKTAVKGLKDSAQITNRFFKWVGLGAVFVSFIVIFFMARSISRPISELSNISNSMSKLDFRTKYIPKKNSSKEVDELGYHMNLMSEALEKTILELQVANNQLMSDIQKMEQIDEMRKEFISNVSHELKTPLALIAGYAEGLKDGISDDVESRDFYCEVIMDETEKMTNMVKKLLTLNQLEFGYDQVEMKCFDITELIMGVINASMLVINQKEVTVNFYNTGAEYVWGDEFKIEEVITNYLSNALNHIDKEKVINIRYEIRGKLLRVKVFNTGDNIPETDLDKVWVKFYKVDKARTREYGGNGIGLSIVKAIMDSHHQRCGVENLPGGVEFWMELDRNI